MRLATATMFSLFFAGDDFAPQTRIVEVCPRAGAALWDYGR